MPPDTVQDDSLESLLEDFELLEQESSSVVDRENFKQKKENFEQKQKENGEILTMRKQWSWWVLIFIGAIIVFDMGLVIAYGLDVLKFKNPQVVMVVVTENFLKIIGLGLIITRELFKKIYIYEEDRRTSDTVCTNHTCCHHSVGN